MPTRRALLIGATAPDLRGVARDMELMTEALLRHRFEPGDIDVVVPATRAQIDAALKRMVCRATEDDVILVHYSGHAAKLESCARPARSGFPLGEAGSYRFLVPSDIEESTDGDFRGYTNAELSLALAALTRKTKNVTVVMDCCYAGRLYRGGEPRSERVARGDSSDEPSVRHVHFCGRWVRAAAEHYEQVLVEHGDELRQRHAEANPYALRLLACGPSSVAYETLTSGPSSEGGPAGVLTMLLHDALMQVEAEYTTWQQLGRIIRETPRRGRPQRPTMAGPYRRLLFSLDERQDLGEVGVSLNRGRLMLVGGSLAGIGRGDRYQIFPPSPLPGTLAVADARVTVVGSGYAEVEPNTNLHTLAPGGSARIVQYGHPRASVELEGISRASPEGELLHARVEALGYLEVRYRGDTPTDMPTVAHVKVESGELRLWAPWCGFDRKYGFDLKCRPDDAGHLVDHLYDALHRLARASVLRDLVSSEPRWEPAPKFTLSAHRIEREGPGPELGRSGEILFFGDRLTVHLRCRQKCFLSALLIGPDAEISLLTRAEPGGVEVLPGEIGYRLGQRSGLPRGELAGVKLVRPSISTTDGRLRGSLVVVLSDEEIDMRGWVQEGVSEPDHRDPLGPSDLRRNIQIAPKARGANVYIEMFDFFLE